MFTLKRCENVENGEKPIDSIVTILEAERILNTLGKEGWELVSIWTHEGVYAVLKRPKTKVVTCKLSRHPRITRE